MPFFLTNSLWGFIVSWLIMLVILATNFSLMVISGRNEIWWPEVFTVRIPFALYSGWVTAATVLNTSVMLKSWGMWDGKDETKPGNDISWDWANFMMFMDEEQWSVVVVWLVFVWYEVVSWSERNPLYGSVYTWASSAILLNLIEDQPWNELLLINVAVIMGLHVVSMFTLTAYMVFEEFQPLYEPLSFWGGGLVGFTDWRLMLN